MQQSQPAVEDAGMEIQYEVLDDAAIQEKKTPNEPESHAVETSSDPAAADDKADASQMDSSAAPTATTDATSASQSETATGETSGETTTDNNDVNKPQEMDE